MSFPKVSIIIPNWNLKKDCLECLASIGKLDYPPSTSSGQAGYEVIVVDNGSTDGSVEKIKHQKLKIKIIENERNLGLAKALNQGIEESEGDHLLLLNNDTILDKERLKKLLEEHGFVKDRVTCLKGRSHKGDYIRAEAFKPVESQSESLSSKEEQLGEIHLFPLVSASWPLPPLLNTG